MDGSTHGKSPLRFVSRHKSDKKTAQKIKSRGERRKELRAQYRNVKLILLWRIFLYTSLSIGLSHIFIKQGWAPVNTEQIQIKGKTKLQAKTIVKFSGLDLPIPLLEINPKDLEKSLLKDLPLKAISVRRIAMPTRLQIELQERKPVALAWRTGPNGREEGMVDKNGYWIPFLTPKQIEGPLGELYIEGWMTKHREWISKVLSNKNKLGSPLKRIILTPNGELSLQTKEFSLVQLGSNSTLIERQLKTLEQLSNNLPPGFRNIRGTTIDMRDPSKPELQMPSTGNLN